MSHEAMLHFPNSRFDASAAETREQHRNLNRPRLYHKSKKLLQIFTSIASLCKDSHFINTSALYISRIYLYTFIHKSYSLLVIKLK